MVDHNFTITIKTTIEAIIAVMAVTIIVISVRNYFAMESIITVFSFDSAIPFFVSAFVVDRVLICIVAAFFRLVIAVVGAVVLVVTAAVIKTFSIKTYSWDHYIIEFSLPASDPRVINGTLLYPDHCIICLLERLDYLLHPY